MSVTNAGCPILQRLCIPLMLGVLLVGVPLLAKAPPAKPVENSKAITSFVKQSQVINTPWPIKRVAITAPDIADVQMLTPRQLLLQGKAVGSTDLVLWGDGDQVQQSRVDVVVNIEQLKDDLKRLFADTALDVRQSRDVIVVSGSLRRAEQALQLQRFLAAMNVRYVDMTTLSGVQQVMIKVRVAEVSRNAIRALGLNTFWAGNDFFGGVTIGSASGGPLQPLSVVPAGGALAQHGVPFLVQNTGVSPAVTVFGGFPQADLEFFLQALAENQYMRILAEPTLVALSGEEANFLAGGEYPIPVVQGSTTGGGTSISVEYKEYGVRLRFRPIVLGENNIRLYVAPEVSQLSDQGAVVIQGFRIPSLLSRRAETTLELHSGQSFAMAGLINRVSNGRSSRVPGAGDIPILGALFRSVRYEQGETELMVMVTATLVEPMNSGSDMPIVGVLHTNPNDWELYGMGQVEGRGAPKVSETELAWIREMGLHRLKGPGAWENYEQGIAPSRASMVQPPKEAPPPPSEPRTITPAPAPEPALAATTQPVGPADDAATLTPVALSQEPSADEVLDVPDTLPATMTATTTATTAATEPTTEPTTEPVIEPVPEPSVRVDDRDLPGEPSPDEAAAAQ